MIQIPLFQAPVKLVLNIFVKYGNVFRKKYTSRVWHVYRMTVQQNFRRGKILEAKKEDNEKATKIDPSAIA